MTQNVNHLDLPAFFHSAAFYRKPDGEMIIWQGPFQKGAETEGQFANMHFFDSQLEWWTGQPITMSVSFFRQKLQAFLTTQKESQFFKKDFVNPDQQELREVFQDVQLKIHREEIDKAVPVVFSRANKAPREVDLAQWIHRLLEQPEGLHVYGFWMNGHGALGAAPEILFHQTGSTLVSMALAGTCPRNEIEKRIPLLRDPKEVREHTSVVKDIESKLVQWGRVRIGPTEVWELPTLLHLRTFLQLEVSGLTASQLIKQLHPTLSLGISPRNYGIQWLKKYPSQENRGYFGAPVVFKLSDNEQIGLVMTRSLFWTPEQTTIGTGCGVVAESDFEREWKELEAKRASVFKSIGLI